MESKIRDITFIDDINEFSLDNLECEGGACPIK